MGGWPGGGEGAEARAGEGADARAGEGADARAGEGADARAGEGADARAGEGADARAGEGAGAASAMRIWVGSCIDAAILHMVLRGARFRGRGREDARPLAHRQRTRHRVERAKPARDELES